MGSRSGRLLALVLGAVAGPAPGARAQSAGVTVTTTAPDTALTPAILRAGLDARAAVVAWSGDRFPRSFVIRVYPARARFVTADCAVVARSDAAGIALLTPRVWAAERCGHDSSDVARVITHEAFHVYHRQVNPAPGFVDPTDLGWFVEGVAVLGAGQLDGAAIARVRRRAGSGYPIATLREVLAGPLGSEGAGSVVAYIDHAWGRATLVHLMRATTLAELLAVLGRSEQELLGGWQEWLME